MALFFFCIWYFAHVYYRALLLTPSTAGKKRFEVTAVSYLTGPLIVGIFLSFVLSILK